MLRRQRSCTDNIAVLVSDIHINFIKDNYLAAAFIDIKGAFDNVIPKILIQDLLDLGLPQNFAMFIKNVIWSRHLSGSDQGLDFGERIAWKGFPQGSNLSPILFNSISKIFSIL